MPAVAGTADDDLLERLGDRPAGENPQQAVVGGGSFKPLASLQGSASRLTMSYNYDAILYYIYICMYYVSQGVLLCLDFCPK